MLLVSVLVLVRVAIWQGAVHKVHVRQFTRFSIPLPPIRACTLLFTPLSTCAIDHLRLTLLAMTTKETLLSSIFLSQLKEMKKFLIVSIYLTVICR